MALYHPAGGYYTRAGRVGERGDFYTSPAAHPAFGGLLCVQLWRMWRRLGRPSRFTAVELGAGDGLLARDICAYADAPLPRVRPVARLRRHRPPQARRHAGRLRRAPARRQRPPAPPGHHRLRNRQRAARRPPVPPLPRNRRQTPRGLRRPGRRGWPNRSPGQPFHTPARRAPGEPGRATTRRLPGRRPASSCVPWLASVSDALDRGYLLTIDYGYPAGELYAPERMRRHPPDPPQAHRRQRPVRQGRGAGHHRPRRLHVGHGGGRGSGTGAGGVRARRRASCAAWVSDRCSSGCDPCR